MSDGMALLLTLVIFGTIFGLMIWIGDRKRNRSNNVIQRYGISYSYGILSFQSKGTDFSEIIHIQKELDFALNYKPEEVHVGAVTVGSVTSGGTYKTGGYTYATGAPSSGKYSLRYMPTAGTTNGITGETIGKEGEVINTILLSPEQYKKAEESDIAQYLNGKDSILVIDPHVAYTQAERIELRMFASGQGGTTHVVHKAYPSYEKCSAIMNWLTQNDQ